MIRVVLPGLAAQRSASRSGVASAESASVVGLTRVTRNETVRISPHCGHGPMTSPAGSVLANARLISCSVTKCRHCCLASVGSIAHLQWRRLYCVDWRETIDPTSCIGSPMMAGSPMRKGLRRPLARRRRDLRDREAATCSRRRCRAQANHDSEADHRRIVNRVSTTSDRERLRELEPYNRRSRQRAGDGMHDEEEPSPAAAADSARMMISHAKISSASRSFSTDSVRLVMASARSSAGVSGLSISAYAGRLNRTQVSWQTRWKRRPSPPPTRT
jgi:hypothetical protein